MTPEERQAVTNDLEKMAEMFNKNATNKEAVVFMPSTNGFDIIKVDAKLIKTFLSLNAAK